MGLGCANRMGPSSTSISRSPLDGSSSCGPSRIKVVGKGVGLGQEPLLKHSLQSRYQSPSPRELNVGNEENVTHNREEGEIREDLGQENDCVNIHRYGNNLYEHSPSSLISVFGRPLLQWDFSGLGDTIGDEDLEPLRVVADGREWGADCTCAIIEEGEEFGAAGQRMEEIENVSSEFWIYESWENSCLAKFSDCLEFPTKGFEKEILDLLRNLVASQKLVKEKGSLTMSKSERELR